VLPEFCYTVQYGIQELQNRLVLAKKSVYPTTALMQFWINTGTVTIETKNQLLCDKQTWWFQP